ncbi:MAG: phosphoribosylaminoimidazolesuccinocarboxamide synthase [Candidatus Micrarchaeota archaeon]
MEAVLKTNLPLKLVSRGKVRDTYELGDKLLMVTTDRLSAFDVVFPQPIPYKGTVLNELSLFWFDYMRDVIGNHLSEEKLPNEYANLSRRSMLVKRAKPVKLECVVRGYLSGSGWKEYKDRGSVCGIKLPGGLLESQKLPDPIFTPSTKADVGHDLNVGEDEAKTIVGAEAFKKVKEASLKIYEKASEYALKRGIIIADTKFEFGEFDGEIILIDEVLTPDSSRFWPEESYKAGGGQASFDKQFVRDYVEKIGWGKRPPAPMLPEEVIKGTSERYIEAYEKMTGNRFVR